MIWKVLNFRSWKFFAKTKPIFLCLHNFSQKVEFWLFWKLFIKCFIHWVFYDESPRSTAVLFTIFVTCSFLFSHKSKSFEDFGSGDEKMWDWVEAETFVFHFLCFLLVSSHFGLCCDFVSTPKNKWWMKAKECLLFNPLSERFYQNLERKTKDVTVFSLCMLL